MFLSNTRQSLTALSSANSTERSIFYPKALWEINSCGAFFCGVVVLYWHEKSIRFLLKKFLLNETV